MTSGRADGGRKINRTMKVFILNTKSIVLDDDFYVVPFFVLARLCHRLSPSLSLSLPFVFRSHISFDQVIHAIYKQISFRLYLLAFILHLK